MSSRRGPETIAILDFGSQYTQLIARRIRERNIYCEIFPPKVKPKKLRERRLKGVILSGGPGSVYDPKPARCQAGILELDVPILGICYGMQYACRELGAKVVPSKNREYGRTQIRLQDRDHLLRGVPLRTTVWMSHGDVVKSPGRNFHPVAKTTNGLLCAVRHKTRPIHALQFHPEVVHTEHGRKMLDNFLFRICRCRADWKMGSYIKNTVDEIRRRVGPKERVICALSGGVDSTVVATLVHRAIGRRLLCVFVDNGVLRLGEADSLLRIFRKELGFRLEFVDAEARFLRKLKGVRHPERKRKVIGHEFIRIFERVARKHRGIRYLAQGTLYPDLIESRSAFGGPTSKIKTHHNVGGLPKDLRLELIEPLRYVFKDEVRRIARRLGIPKRMWERQPFPGPGLAVRVMGEVTREKLEVLRRADKIVREEIEAGGWHRRLWQFFCVLVPVRTVGVMGDARTYDHVVAVRAVTSQDGMTADWARLPESMLERISSRITNEVAGVNRVVYDVSSKPPSTIEWE